MLRFSEHLDAILIQLERDNLRRRPRPLERHGPVLHLAGRRVLGLCSNDYLGLACDPRLAAALRNAIEHTSCGAGASRLISGTQAPHLEAESALARFVGQPAAVLFSSGYAANVGTLQGLVAPGDAVFSDALNHASLIDGCRLSRAAIHIYRHCDVDHLEQLLDAKRRAHRAALIVTESLFSMDGDEAPLRELQRLADVYDAGLLVDEAHALGVMGPSGRGLAREAGLQADVVIGTLGKAFGLAGAFAAGSPALAAVIQNRARSHVFSTAPPPAWAAATLTALELIERADEARARVLAHAGSLREGLGTLGYAVPPGRGPIVPCLVGDSAVTVALSDALLEHGVFVHAVRPPTVPPGTARLRVTPMAIHSEDQIAQALDAFARVSRNP